MVLGHDITVGQRTQDVRISEDISFDTMLLKKVTIRGLEEAGFLRPSPIQLRGIPLGKCGFDLLLEAKSGTGKTAVFTVIALEKLDFKKGLQTIILAPTREIAAQISDVITEIGSKYKDLNVAVVIGGLPVKEDIEKFKENVHIVVGSPGRLRHLIQDKHIDISSVRLVVLDEADKLMMSSFLPDINYIFSLLPDQKQVIMSSATYSDEAKEFVSKYVQKAIHVCPDSNSILLGISQKVVTVPQNTNIVKQTKYKYEELKKIFNEKQFKQCLIFCNYQVRVGEVYRMLTKDQWPVEQLYGQQNQNDRLDALKTLQEYKCRILVSTDLAARGIDASNVDIVINFEPPHEWETYLHRIGRAGRYGSYGTAITILSEGKETAKFKETLAQTKIPFDLCNLWNDDPFDLNVKEINGSLWTNIKNPVITAANNSHTHRNGHVSNDQLWKALTTGTKKNEEISSFDEICESFNLSCKPKIETFADLMDSFTTNKNDGPINKYNPKFKHIKVKKLHVNIAKYCDTDLVENGCTNEMNATKKMEKETIQRLTLECQRNMNHTKKPSSSQLLLPCYENGKLVPQQSQQGDLEKEINETVSTKQIITNMPTASKNINVHSKIRIKQSSYADESHKSQVDKLHDHTDKIDEYSDSDEAAGDPVKQALIDAGLPTAFGKKTFTKKRNRVHKYKHTHDSYEKEAKCNGKVEIDENQQSEDITKSNTMDDFGTNKYIALNNYYETQFLESKPDQTASIERNVQKPRNKNRQSHSYANYEHTSQTKAAAGKSDYNQSASETMKKSSSNVKDKLVNHKKSTASGCIPQMQYQSDFSEIFRCEIKPSQSDNVYQTYKNNSNKTFSCQNQKTKMSSKSIEEMKSRQFNLWYSQLKQQTQYIQQTLYIETLRNL